jgi:hypothetical protein
MLRDNSIKEPLTDEKLKVILKRVVWDYNISEDDLLEIYKGNMEGRGVNQVQLKAKLLNTYPWHQLIKWFGFETSRGFLKDEIIQMIFPASYRQKLFHAKRILRA